MKKFIAFSGGVESTALCLMFGHKATAIVADTGWEHPEMYDRWNLVETAIKKIHRDFVIVRVCRNGDTLQSYIRRANYFPSIKNRFCTRMFKIEPIDDYLRDAGECELMIGLNWTERDRVGNHGLLSNVSYSYPLIDLKLTRDDCIKLLKEYDLLPDLPVYMQRGGCVGCFFKSKKEFAAMALLAPEQIDGIIDIEEAVQDDREKYYGVRDGIPNMRKFVEMVRNQSRLFDLDEIYTSKDISTPCGVFCHR